MRGENQGRQKQFQGPNDDLSHCDELLESQEVCCTVHLFENRLFEEANQDATDIYSPHKLLPEAQDQHQPLLRKVNRVKELFEDSEPSYSGISEPFIEPKIPITVGT